MTTANAYPVTQTIRTIGILGGGQLGMMLAQAALPPKIPMVRMVWVTG